jgi:fructose-1,6-bisphosphatase/inositol monophosphatase family enzyme
MNQYLDAAIKAARAAGALVRENFGRPLKVDVGEAHDIKVEFDVRSQALITELLLEKFPDQAILAKKAKPRMPPPSLSG